MTLVSKAMTTLQYVIYIYHSFSSKKQVYFNFMAKMYTEIQRTRIPKHFWKKKKTAVFEDWFQVLL